MDYCPLHQQVSLHTLNQLNGRMDVPLEELVEAKILSWHRLRTKAHHVILVGDLRLEGNPDCRKLICSRMQRMLTSLSNSVVESLFSNILPICGKSGFEVNRVGGSNGLVTEMATKNMLAALHGNDKLLPNKAGACLIIKCKKYFCVFYTRNESSDVESRINFSPFLENSVTPR